MVSGDQLTMEMMEESIKKIEDRVLKKTIKRKIIGYGEKEHKLEPVWLTEEIKNEIKVRKHFNRLQRNSQNEVEKAGYRQQYKEQKEKVQDIIKGEITGHEIKITRDIRAERDGGGKMWEQMGKLQGKELKRRKEVKLYDNNGNVIADEEVAAQMMGYWQGIYRSSENKMEEEWNEQSAEQYRARIGEEERVATIKFHDSLID